MPFQSQAQRGYLFAHHPEMAKRWAREYPNQKHLPEHVEKRKARSKHAKGEGK